MTPTCLEIFRKILVEKDEKSLNLFYDLDKRDKKAVLKSIICLMAVPEPSALSTRIAQRLFCMVRYKNLPFDEIISQIPKDNPQYPFLEKFRETVKEWKFTWVYKQYRMFVYKTLFKDFNIPEGLAMFYKLGPRGKRKILFDATCLACRRDGEKYKVICRCLFEEVEFKDLPIRVIKLKYPSRHAKELIRNVNEWEEEWKKLKNIM